MQMIAVQHIFVSFRRVLVTKASYVEKRMTTVLDFWPIAQRILSVKQTHYSMLVKVVLEK